MMDDDDDLKQKVPPQAAVLVQRDDDEFKRAGVFASTLPPGVSTHALHKSTQYHLEWFRTEFAHRVRACVPKIKSWRYDTSMMIVFQQCVLVNIKQTQ